MLIKLWVSLSIHSVCGIVLIILYACESCSVVSNSLQHHGLYSPWNSSVQNTGVGSLSLLQGIFPTQGLNLGLPPCSWILNQLSHKGSPRRLEWVAYPFSSGSSQPRNWTRVSCIAGRFFTNWAIREKKGMTEDEMVGWHHQLNGHEFEQAPGVGGGQGSLVCCRTWGRKELDMTERLNWFYTRFVIFILAATLWDKYC